MSPRPLARIVQTGCGDEFHTVAGRRPQKWMVPQPKGETG